MKTIHLIAAARPNFMKIAPLYHALKATDWAEPILVHTGQHYDQNMSDAILKDLGPQAKVYGRSMLGEVLSVALILKDIEHIVVNNFKDYTEERKLSNLKQLLGSGSDSAASPGATSIAPTGGSASLTPYTGDDEVMFTEQVKPRRSRPEKAIEEIEVEGSDFTPAPEENEQYQRAVESKEYQELQQMNLSGQWGRAVARYGVQFLLRIHFRKYEFQMIRSLLANNRIAAEKDLLFIKEAIGKMLLNTEKDTKLQVYIQDMEDIRVKTLEKLMALDAVRPNS